MHQNPQQPYPQQPQPRYDRQPYTQQYPPTVIVQKKGNGCLKAVLVGAAVLTILVVIGVVLGSRSDDAQVSLTDGPEVTAQAAKPGKSQAPRKAHVPGLGDLVKDGKFAFKVTKVEKGLSQVGEGFTAHEAQGQYVLVHLTVKNIGDEAQMFTDSAQKLIDAKGRTFDADSGAAIWLQDSNAFLENINPGNSVNGLLLFDVPKNLTLKAIELHDSIFSGGVTVSLR
ncbi:DUF4352 domain-containing protein [Microbispora sp. NEAU-D428]|uniref:DUF4352 domain-containing protein n=1 Tax=Microbispora sitophila TaxID=2771537 RepID=UPI00186910BB|nr:DUF4352 domain-containing protein [Microbispora sitophila]MBE3011710.1 DUF4352 domain-containing protein [Microbispora sitophila]